ncbi:MAG: hypothetical protein ACKOXM_02720 [Agromyces sp.]
MRLRLGAVLTIALAAAVTLSGCSSEIRNQTVATLTTADNLDAIAAKFSPGRILSDQQFYDDRALTEAGIQSFLDAIPCTPKDESPCLADFRTRLPAFAAETELPGHCAAIEPQWNASAAQIIERVALACGVSPKLLLVLMQKEQSLLTRPSAYGYERATGYGCPDSTGCEAKYFGFVNQVYRAAWQFRQYSLQPKRTFQIGTVPVAFHPDPACGNEPVVIENQATANLYNYTPYQPNAAALSDPAGEGDACSAWGNLNVWLLWNIWFGDPLATPLPDYLPACVTHENGARCDQYRLTAPFTTER